MSDASENLDPDRLIRAAGDRALLVTPLRRDEVSGLVDALRFRPLGGVEDVLPAAETVLVTLLAPEHAESVRRELATLLPAVQESAAEPNSGKGARQSTEQAGSVSTGGRQPAGTVGIVSRGTLLDNDSPDEPLVIPVHYNGADLTEVARQLRMSEAEVVAEHTGTVWRCAFVGFAPGFGYLASPDDRLTVPRRSQSRTTIPAGAVALAGGYTAVYPRSTPGGWHLIGTTELPMWDVDRDPPALIHAGGFVRFIDADRS